MMVTALFLSLFCFAFLSAEFAAQLGIATYRIYIFSAIVTALVAVSVLVHPVMSKIYKRDLAILALLFFAILLLSVGKPISFLDLKIVLPLLILAAAPNIATRLTYLDLPRVTWLMLAFFVIAASLPLILNYQASLKGYDGYQRYDSTGSVVTLSSMATLLALITPSIVRSFDSSIARSAAIAIGVWAVILLFMTATRTAIVTVALAWVLTVMVGVARQRTILRVAAGLAALTLLFLIYTFAVSDAFYLRLAGSGDATDYTSGRLHSVQHWLALTRDHPFGLGLGYVRSLMGDARPILDNGLLLEWPHNEFIRFYIEGGVAGLTFIAAFIFILAKQGLAAARMTADPRNRMLIIAIIADIIAQSSLQNYFNSIYHATVLIAVLLIACINCRQPVVLSIRDRNQSRNDAAAGLRGIQRGTTNAPNRIPHLAQPPG